MDLKYIRVECIETTATAGATPDKCVCEAFCLSISRGCDVAVSHNGTRYYIEYERTFKAVKSILEEGQR